MLAILFLFGGGRWICAWCGKDMEPNGEDYDSSTICEDCQKKYFPK